MSDRIAVVNKGRIEQLGNVSDIYHRPRTAFVANFIGQANIYEGSIVGRDGATVRVSLEGKLEVTVAGADIAAGATRVLVSVRPEKVSLEKSPPPAGATNCFEARVTEELFMGATDQLEIRTDNGLELTAMVANEGAAREAFHEGDRVYCQLHPDDIVVVSEGATGA